LQLQFSFLLSLPLDRGVFACLDGVQLTATLLDSPFGAAAAVAAVFAVFD